jgi:hypothetical protein
MLRRRSESSPDREADLPQLLEVVASGVERMVAG